MGTSDEAERMKRITALGHWYVSYLGLTNPSCIKRTGCNSCLPDEGSPNIRGHVCRLNIAFHGAWREVFRPHIERHELRKLRISSSVCCSYAL
jgi:hypothetical protein